MKKLLILNFLLSGYSLLLFSNDLNKLDTWSKKVLSLKQFPIDLRTVPNKIKYQKSILTLTDFTKAINQVANILKLETQNSKQWLGQSISQASNELFNLERFIYNKDKQKNFIFKPYAQRIIVPAGSIIAFFGDLHGSAHTLIRSLLKFKIDGLIDNNFRIIKRNFYIFFLGDYTDRGIYGVEALYTMFKLKIANPNKVFLVRGNHEDYNVNLEFSSKNKKHECSPGFINELQHKFGTTEHQEIKIFRFYDLLPVVIYLGTGTINHVNYVQCCHGGMEIGFNPYSLLHAKTIDKSDKSDLGQKEITNLPFSKIYQLIETLKRKTNYYSKFNNYYRYVIKNNFSIDRLCTELQDFVPKAPFIITPPDVHKNFMGFMWNDFYVNRKSIVGPRRIHFTEQLMIDPEKKHYSGWVFGQKITKNILSWANSYKVTLAGVIRAHQHNNSTGGSMLNLLCQNRGVVDIWKDRTVYCLVSAPDSILTESNQCFIWDSFITINIQPQFKNWKIIHHWSNPYIGNKEWSKQILC